MLRFRAAERLSLLVEKPEEAMKYKSLSNQIRGGINRILYRTEGYYVSATEIGCLEDIWTSVFAVWLGIPDINQEEAVIFRMKQLLLNGDDVSRGYIRHIPENGSSSYWDRTDCPPAEYQNGGYWSTPHGWFVYALAKSDRNQARSVIREWLDHTLCNTELGAPYEWMSKDGSRIDGKKYGTSATFPYLGWTRIVSELR